MRALTTGQFPALCGLMAVSCAQLGKPHVEAAAPATREAMEARAPAVRGLTRLRHDAELFLRAGRAVAIGRASAGARVDVLELREDEALVHIEAFGIDAWVAGGALESIGEAAAAAETTLLAWASGAGPEERVTDAGSPEGLVYDVKLELLPNPSGSTFATTRCGSVRLLRRERGGVWVSQTRHGVELRGWTASPLITMEDGRCPPRAPSSPDLALGYRPLQPGQAAGALRRHHTVYWLTRHGARLACDVRRLTWEGPQEGDMSGPCERRGIEGQCRFGFSVDEGRVILYGPTFFEARKPEVSYKCAEVLQLAEAHAEGVRLLPSDWKQAPLAFHPEDAQTWFFDLPACQRALDAKLGSQALALLHVGC